MGFNLWTNSRSQFNAGLNSSRVRPRKLSNGRSFIIAVWMPRTIDKRERSPNAPTIAAVSAEAGSTLNLATGFGRSAISTGRQLLRSRREGPGAGPWVEQARRDAKHIDNHHRRLAVMRVDHNISPAVAVGQ